MDRAPERQRDPDRRTDPIPDAQLLFDTVAQGVVYQDAAGAILSMNAAAERILGRTREELAGATALPAEQGGIREDGAPFPADEHPAMVALRTGRELRDVVMGVFNPRRREYRWVSVRAVPIFDGPEAAKPSRVCTLLDDLTERRLASEAIRWDDRRYRELLESSWRSQAKFRSIFDRAPLGIGFSAPDGTFLEVNDCYLDIVGYSREELLRLDFRAITHPDDLAMDDAFAQALLRGERDAYHVEKRYVRKDGGVVWVSLSAGLVRDPAGRPEYFAFAAEDVTARRRTAEALRESEEKLRAAFRTTPVGFALTTPEGEFLDANPAFCRLTGYALDELRAMSFRQLVHPDDLAGNAAQNRRMLAGEIPGFVIENRYVRKGGETRWVRKSVSLGGSGGAPRWVVALVEDVTERRRGEERLRDADRRKDEFLAMLSHELRNPLAPMRNASYLLRHAAPGTEQARHAVEVVERQTDHLARLVDDLLDVTRIARGRIELRRARVDLGEVVARAAEDVIVGMHDRGVRFDVEIPDGALWTDADATRVTQLVGNLLHNAAKYTRRGDTVTVSVRAGEEGAAEIRVRDTGAGIEPALLPVLFEPFVQGERTLARSEGGLGLGLALVKMIAELHGGGVRAESPGKGKGAEFVVRLPLAPGVAPSSRPDPVPGGRPAGRRVLVVDDNRDAAESLAEIVRLLGHAADVAYDGLDAVEKARALRPDAVLCDIGLPGMSGYEVSRALRASLGDAVQLVALSGYAQPEDVQRAIEAGFDVHVAKPCGIDALERLLG